MFALLQFRQRDRTWDFTLISAVVLAAIAGVCWGTSLMGLVFAFAYAILRALSDSTALATLCKGRCLEEVRLSHTRPAELVDGVALFSFRCARTPVVVVMLLVGVLGYAERVMLGATAPEELMPPATQGLFVLTALLLVIPLAYLALLVQTSLAYQRWPRFWQAWAAIPLLGLLAADMESVLLWVGLAAAATLLARHQALALLAEGESRRTRKASRVNPWVGACGDGPIALREQRREARQAPGGILGAFLWRYGLTLSLLLLLLAAYGPDTAMQPGLFFIMFVLAPLRAAVRLRLAVVQEREAGSFEVLGLTQLKAEEFVDGWTRVGYEPRLLENLLLGILLMLIEPNFARYGCVVLGLVAPVAGAQIGLWGSALSANRSQALGNVLALLLGFIGGLAAWAFPLYEMVSAESFVVFSVVSGFGLVYLLRLRCLALLEVEKAPERLPQGVCRVDLVATAAPSDGSSALITLALGLNFAILMLFFLI